MKMVLVGVAIGLVAALMLTRFMSTLLFGVEARDPLTLSAAVLTLFVIALLACYLPSRRAARVNPMVALRNE
jgi:putative ABC transport system permease protein